MSQKPEAVYSYEDVDGVELFQCVRFPDKRIRQRHHDGERWAWNLTDVPLVLYHLPEVLAAGNEHRAVWCPEGEKDTDALTALGFVATTSPLGASSWRDEYADDFRGCAMVLIPVDADEPGRKLGEAKAASCFKRGVRARILDLYPDRDDGSDVSDWIAKHGDTARKELEKLARKAPDWRPPKPPRPKLPIVPFGKLAASVGPYDASRDYLGAFLRGGTRAHIIGPIGHGKTTFMAEAVSSAVHGREFLGFTGKDDGIRALYIDLEMPLDLLVETLVAARFNPDDDPYLDVVSLPDGLEVDKNAEHRQMIFDAAEDYEIVVIDPWFKLIAEELSDGMRNVRTVLSFLDEIRSTYLDTAVLIGFHANEPQRGQKVGRLGDASGYKAFQRPCDTALTFERMRGDRSRVTWAKVRSSRLPKMGEEWLVEWERGNGFRRVEKRKATDELYELLSDEWQSKYELATAWERSPQFVSDTANQLCYEGRAERTTEGRRAMFRRPPQTEQLAA